MLLKGILFVSNSGGSSGFLPHSSLMKRFLRRPSSKVFAYQSYWRRLNSNSFFRFRLFLPFPTVELTTGYALMISNQSVCITITFVKVWGCYTNPRVTVCSSQQPKCHQPRPNLIFHKIC